MLSSLLTSGTNMYRWLFAGGIQGAIYDATVMSSLYQDTSFTSPVTAIGQTVKGWKDLSGNGKHMTSSVGVVLRQDANGKNYLDFTGTQAFDTAYVQSAYPLTLVASAYSTQATSSIGIIETWQDDANYKQISGYSNTQYALFNRGNAGNQGTTESFDTDTRAHVVTAKFLSSTNNLMADGVDATSPSSSTNNFGTCSKLVIGRTFSASGYFIGRIYGAAAFAEDISLTKRKRVENLLSNRNGQIHDLLNGLIAEGDSITVGYNATAQNGYVQQANAVAPIAWNYYNQAVSGNTMAQIAARLSTVQSRCSTMLSNGMQPIVTLLTGQNDKPTTTADADTLYAAITSYIQSVKSYGAKVVMCTPIACNPAVGGNYTTYMSTGRPQLIADILSNAAGADAICDFSANSNINVWNNTYYSDDLHPSDAGHALMYPIYKAAINSIRKTSY